MTTGFLTNNTVSTATHNGVTAFTYQSGSVAPASQTLTDGATITMNCATGQNATVTLAGNRTFAAPTNQTASTFYVIEVRQDATGNRTAAWNAVFKWVNSTAPTLSSVALTRDYFMFESDGTNMYEVGRTQGVL